MNMKKHGKKYREVVKDLDLKKSYSLEEAIGLVKKTNPAKFDATIEAHLKLNIDLAKPEQNIRSTVILPKGTGRDVKVLALVGEKDEKAAHDAGADFVGLEEFADKIVKSWLGFDVAIATPEAMPKIAKIAKVLGSRGMMPNPKAGTVVQDIGKAVEEFKKGKIEFRSDSLGGIHIGIGKTSFAETDLLENFQKFYRALTAMKPSTVKGQFVKSVYLASSMGPGVKVDLGQLK